MRTSSTRCRTSNEALLRFGFLWIRFAVFGEPTMKVRAEAEQAVQEKLEKKKKTIKSDSDARLNVPPKGSSMSGNGKRGDILVIGGGISGLTAAIEAAEAGANVTLVEKEAFLGGRVARMNLYFPKMCPPSCGIEINIRRVKTNPLIRTLTLSTVESISGGPGSIQGHHPEGSPLREQQVHDLRRLRGGLPRGPAR